MYKQIDSNKRRTLFLMIIFIVIIIALGFVYDYFYNTYSGVIFAVMIASIMASISFFSGDKIALATSGAKQIQREDSPYVFRMVENLCITAGLPMPKVYIIEDDAPNAFATGRDPQHASIALTTGIIKRLENNELEGVIAHELAHIKNYDIRLMMVVIVLVGTIALLSDMFIRFSFFGKSSSNSKNNANLIIMIVGVVLMILSPIIAKLIQLAISRKREYLADASGALLTRYPAGLANALEKISTYNQPMKKVSSATSHLYIANPLFGKKSNLKSAFSTHPPIQERIKKLRSMA